MPALYETLLDDAAFGIPETIQHDDLHDGQVFVRGGRYRILDWGDSSVGHPFFTLTVTLRVLGYALELPETAPELFRFRNAYLEPWTRLAPRAELLAALPGALLLGGLCRLLTWREVVAGMPQPFAEESDEYPAELRRLLLRAAP